MNNRLGPGRAADALAAAARLRSDTHARPRGGRDLDREHRVRRQFEALRRQRELELIESGVPYACVVPDCLANRNLTIDHKRSIAAGGNNDLGNLQFLCGRHNSAKRDRDWTPLDLARPAAFATLERVALFLRRKFARHGDARVHDFIEDLHFNEGVPTDVMDHNSHCAHSWDDFCHRMGWWIAARADSDT